MNLWLTGSLGAVYLHNLHEKRITESQDGRNFASARPRWVICTRVTTLQSSFTRNALVSSQTHERNFFSRISIGDTLLCFCLCWAQGQLLQAKSLA